MAHFPRKGKARKTPAYEPMTEYAKAHNEWIAAHKGVFTEEEMQYHLQRIAFLQHERAVHLPVMLVSIVGFLLAIVFCFFQMSLISILGLLLLTILSFCYIKHYFFLENTVQAWYHVYSNWKLGQLDAQS